MDGAVNADDVVGYTCVAMDGQAVWGNTLDPTCNGGSLSCTDGTSYLTEADCTGAGHFWSPTTCASLQAQTPTANCAFLIPVTFTIFAGGAGKQPWFGHAQQLPYLRPVARRSRPPVHSTGCPPRCLLYRVGGR